jgi:3',5'-cyclic-AMP phosphodiesterase
MRIAQISDTHILAPSSDDPMAERRADDLRRCVADINRRGIDAVIHTGDSVHHGTADEYARLRTILFDLKPPLYIAPGNRDRLANLRAAFHHLEYLPRQSALLHYAVEDRALRLVALDSVAAGERKGVFGADRVAWLEETLARAPDRPTLLFIHHPPFDVVPDYYGGYRHPKDAASLAAVIRRHAQVRRLLCGHVHRLHQEAWAGTTATVMPSVAVDLRKGVDPALGEMPLYLIHEAADDGEVATSLRTVPK